ncbi:protein O-GlcNAcase [Enterococcus faecium]|nr:protein O-GlcNAcase [Enterococcus faecium]
MKETKINQVKKKLSRYQEVVYRNHCLKWSKNKLNVRFNGLFYRFEQLEEVWKPVTNFQSCPVQLINDPKETYDLCITHLYNQHLKNDGFYLKVTNDNQLTIESANLRGFQYAMEALLESFFSVGDQLLLPELILKHEPSVKIRGIIEGFYGIPWTHEMRLSLFSYMKDNQLNTFMYAPKDDELLRKKWHELYDAQELDKFKELLSVAEASNIDFWYLISPGNDIDITCEEDIQVLLKKLEQLIELGVFQFGLLMDDIDYQLKGAAKRRFREPAFAHAYLVNRVEEYLSTRLSNHELVICPTEYDNRHGSRYLATLSQEIPEQLPFFWTGPSTLAASISTEELQEMASVYQRPMLIWDNIPVNDYLEDKELLFMSPYENRTPNLSKERYQVTGVVSNPMAQLEASKFTINSMANYLWNCERFDPLETWTSVVEKVVGSKLQPAYLTLTNAFPNHYTSSLLSDEELLLAKDPEWVTKEMAALVQAVKWIQQEQHTSRLRTELEPWLQAITESWTFWQEWQLKKDPKEAEEWLAKKKTHRIGRDLVTAHLEQIIKS